MFLAAVVGGQMGKQRATEKKEKQKDEKYIKLPKATKDEKWSSLKGQLRASRHTLETYVSPTISKNKLIPKQIVQNAKAFIFLTVYKAGFLMAGNLGYGLIIVRNKQHKLSSPVAVGMMALTGGAFSGGSFKTKQYLFVINSENVIEQFIKNEKLILDSIAGPMGRDTDISVYPTGDIYSYPDERLNGKTISFKLGTNEKFYNLKGITINDILFENDVIKMPQNDHYEKLIDLLDTYILDHVFPQNIEEKVDIETIAKMHDKNIENSVDLLYSIYTDIDKDVIKVILMKQCWGNIKNAMDILSKMSKCQIDADKSKKVIQDKDIDGKEIVNDEKLKTAFSSKKLVEIARSNTQKYLELSDNDEEEEDTVFTPNSKQSQSTLLLDNLINSFDD
eukprot:498160_1